jgi:hypothetical protein
MISLGATNEEFEVWTPLPNIGGQFALEELEDGKDGFLLTLRCDNERLLRIDLQEVLSYRLTPLALNAGYWDVFLQQAEGFGAFWRAVTSAWIESLQPDPEMLPLTPAHFVVLTDSEAIEFLCTDTPHISWLDNFFGDAI